MRNPPTLFPLLWMIQPHYNEKKALFTDCSLAHSYLSIIEKAKEKHELKLPPTSGFRCCCQWEIPDVGDGRSFSALTNHVNRVESLIAGQRCMRLGTGTLCKLVFALSQRSGANSVKVISSHQEALAVIPTTCFPFEMTFQWVYSFTVWFLLVPAV